MCKALQVNFKPYTPFNRKPVETGVVSEVHLKTLEMYENAGAKQPEPLHAGYVEDERWA